MAKLRGGLRQAAAIVGRLNRMIGVGLVYWASCSHEGGHIEADCVRIRHMVGGKECLDVSSSRQRWVESNQFPFTGGSSEATPPPSIVAGLKSVKGKRRTQEDAYTVLYDRSNRNKGFFAVYDGHGGSRASSFCSCYLPEYLARRLERAEEAGAALRGAVGDADDIICAWERSTGYIDGSTIAAALAEDTYLVVANCGDSRALVCSKADGAIPLSIEHKPDNPSELSRLLKAGAPVTGLVNPFGGVFFSKDVPRVCGYLAMSRALGNYHIKKFVPADPDIVYRDIEDSDVALVLATDGLWDVVSDAEVCQIVLDSASPQKAADELTELALQRGSSDNITVLVVGLHETSFESEPLRLEMASIEEVNLSYLENVAWS